MACLDTTVFLDLRGRNGKRWQKPAQETIRRLLADGETLATTQFNVAELYVGVQQSNDPQREKQLVLEALADLEILEFDEAGAWAFANIQATLRKLGRPSGDMDALIAGVALVNGEPLVTRNGRHFVDMPGLMVVEY